MFIEIADRLIRVKEIYELNIEQRQGGMGGYIIRVLRTKRLPSVEIGTWHSRIDAAKALNYIWRMINSKTTFSIDDVHNSLYGEYKPDSNDVEKKSESPKIKYRKQQNPNYKNKWGNFDQRGDGYK